MGQIFGFLSVGELGIGMVCLNMIELCMDIIGEISAIFPILLSSIRGLLTQCGCFSKGVNPMDLEKLRTICREIVGALTKFQPMSAALAAMCAAYTAGYTEAVNEWATGEEEEEGEGEMEEIEEMEEEVDILGADDGKSSSLLSSNDAC